MAKLKSMVVASLSLLCFVALLVAADGLTIEIAVSDSLLTSKTDGRVMVLFAPQGTDPLDDLDVVTSPDLFFGKNVYQLSKAETVVLQGGSGNQPLYSVWGYPNVSLDDVEPGDYTIQAFLNPYETVTRSDGSTVTVKFPCGDGALPVDGPGSLFAEATNVTITGSPQTVQLTFDNITAVEDFTGSEIGGCSQGNYEDLDLLKYVKIRSDVLSDFWNRDMYIGANILLPSSYNASDTTTRYPVIYNQGHWPANVGAYRYDPTSDDQRAIDFVSGWNSGLIPNTSTPIPKFILVTIRHETPLYDDSYAVNTANLGPYGDGINDELIPYLESKFHMIAQPYARVQDGGSTGGWESAASLIFRPDLFGVCFSSYPDSLDFHRHQDIPLYTAKNAYVRDDGSDIYSIRENVNGTLTNEITVAQENHWELTYGSNSRSSQQWDIWNAVFGAQGWNNYPLEPWDKVTGEIFPAAVEYWKTMDLANHIVSHWDDDLNLGVVLKNRIYVYVGSWDNYFLNEGVEAFRRTVEGRAGVGWVNVTVLEGEPHGGNYQLRGIWDYLQLVESWVGDHAPDGKTPLSASLTSSTARGNIWQDVISRGGRAAAVARQSDPVVVVNGDGTIVGSVGRWDPGVKLEAMWVVNGKGVGKVFEVEQGQEVVYTGWEGMEAGERQFRVAVAGYWEEEGVCG